MLNNAVGIYGIPTPASPIPTANLYRWYDASNAASITSSGGLVSQWNDISGNAGHLTQGTSAQQPTTGTTTQNGKNVLVCSLSQMTNTISITSNALTVFSVFRKSSGGNGNNTYTRWASFWNSANTSTSDYGDTNGIMAYAATTSLGSGSPSVGLYRNNANITGLAYSYGSYASAVRLNGTSGKVWYNSNTATGTTSGTALNSNRFTAFGSNTQSPVNGDGFLNGWVAEIIIYNAALSDGDCDSVLSYLKTKWSVS